MQFSKRVSQLARAYNIDPKDVLFAFLITSGATTAEAFAVIHRPAATTNAALSTRASNHIGQRPGLQKLIAELETDPDNNTDQPTTRRGRPRTRTTTQQTEDNPEVLDYTDKDAVLKEYAKAVGEAEKISDKLSALNGIANLQRMKQEAKVEEEKRVIFYVPLSYERCEELTEYLAKYFSKNGVSQ